MTPHDVILRFYDFPQELRMGWGLISGLISEQGESESSDFAGAARNFTPLDSGGDL